MPQSNWWDDSEQVARLEKRYAAIGVDRRFVLKLMAGAAGAASAATLLAACGGDDDDDTATPEPTEGAGGQEPTATEAAESGGETPAATEGTTDGELAEVQVFRYNKDRDPLHFDYNLDLYADGDSAAVAMLGQFNVDYEAVPDLAESWEANEDASVWTFKIRQDTYWSNGDPVTAHDFEWSWKRQLDPATGASYAGFLYDIQGAESFNTGGGATADDVGVVAIDDYTLETTMQQPTVYWPDVFTYVAAAPAHRASVEANPDNWTDPNVVDAVPSAGPFKLVSWEHDVKFTLEKNEMYWNSDNITLTTVEGIVIPPESAMLAYDNDEIDQVLRGELGQLQRIDSDPDLSQQKFIFNTYGSWYLVPDANFEPFDVPEVRMAMAHAIDRDVICNQVLQGLAKPAYTAQPPGTPGSMEETFPELTAYDPELAMSLLDGTPYEGGQNWPAITLTQREEGDAPKIAADAMIAMLKENLGMDIDHEIGEPKTTYERMYNHEIQLMWVRWYIDYPDLNNYLFFDWYSAFPSGNRHSWSNDEYDQLTSDARSENDPAVRQQMYLDAQRIQLEEAAAIYVYYIYAYGMNKPWLGNMPVNSAGEPTPGWNIFIRDYDYYQILKQ